MLKKRIIPKFLFKDGRLVKFVRFHDKLRQVGNPVTTAKVYDSYGVDELVFLDIHSSVQSHGALKENLEKVSQEVFMPLTAGGGVRTLDDIHALLKAGADKVSINTASVERPEFVREAAQRFGNQCIVASIDYKEISPGTYRVYTHGGYQATDLDPIHLCRLMEDNHCGEVMLTSIDRDGTMGGFDLDMIHRVSQKLSIPVIASSGAGSLEDCIQAFEAGASAITISTMFFFTDQSPIKVRSFLRSNGINVRASSSSRN